VNHTLSSLYLRKVEVRGWLLQRSKGLLLRPGMGESRQTTNMTCWLQALLTCCRCRFCTWPVPAALPC
jgi:hypothetical protein